MCGERPERFDEGDTRRASPAWVECVLAAAVILLAGACVAFAGMFAATRCEPESDERTPRQGRSP